MIEREQVWKPGGELKICRHVIRFSAHHSLIQTMNKEKAAIHLWPITFMKGWMHNLCAHQHEMQR